MEHHFLAVDFKNFIDSVGIADKRGGRIRLSNRNAVDSFMEENHLDKVFLHEFSHKCELPAVTIISTGLMKGLYAYSMDTKTAYVYVAAKRDITPLQSMPENICFDVALSYASEEREQLVLPLKEELEANGASVYLLDVAEDPSDPIWGIRFREGLFYSHFWVPVLTRSYLGRAGTAIEMFDIARITVEHRGTEFFYPLIPLATERNALFSSGPEACGLDNQAFEWMKTHVFSLPKSMGIPWLSRFFVSLSSNARGVFDSTFLDCLSPLIDYIEFCKFKKEDRNYVQVLIRNSALTFHHFLMYDDGVVKYFGMGEPQVGAQPRKNFQDPVGAILSWLGLNRVEAQIMPRKLANPGKIVRFPGAPNPIGRADG